MNHRYLLLAAGLLSFVSAAAQTTPTSAPPPPDTLAAAPEPFHQTAAVLPWWLPTAAQCAGIRALEAKEAPAQAARREKQMQRHSKKLRKKYLQATE